MGMSKWWTCCAVLALISCAPEPALVASNCDDPEGCSGQALKLDAVDILLVVDDSGSIASSVKALKQQLPRLLNAITSGEGEGTSFPPAQSVHVAVTTTDMGIGERDDPTSLGCDVAGQDGVFIKPGERKLSCEVQHPSYLSFDGGPAAVATVESVSCVPLVGPDPDADISDQRVGCGYEQPLEAVLKSLWSKDDDSVEFVQGFGHGDDENAGFLRENSLLVVVVVTDEDDCSPADLKFFDRVPGEPVNLLCSRHPDSLQRTSRYVEGLRALRPNNKNVIFGVVGGIPAELVSAEYRARYDLSKDSGVGEYYAAILADERMQESEDTDQPGPVRSLRPSCKDLVDGQPRLTFPPRRLLEVAKGFGTRSVVGSLCTDDFGVTTGQVIRAIGEQLANPAGK
ncbi:MAG TPA: hypothetical protein VJV78_32720 [Polyangiales bacterium]|nr:hypothetical protein [Polyangiales bacterium]